jgi:hypothetical protein
MERRNVHDNFVYAISVDLERRLLTLHTQYRDGEGPYDLIDVRFEGLVAHHFDDVAEPSILLDVEEASPGEVIQQWPELFERGLNNGWPPGRYSDLTDLSTSLEGQGVHGYIVMGSCGLDGFVLARGVAFLQRQSRAEPG